MKTVSEIFKDAQEKSKSVLSYEIFPPKGELTLDAAHSIVSKLSSYSPGFISVTCSAGGSDNNQSTNQIAALIQDDFGLTSIAHITCVGATDKSFESSIADLKAKGIRNVLALRGDLPHHAKPLHFLYAKDIIPALKDRGFCVGAAAYPEGHITCDSPKANIDHLKAKCDAGADFFVTQLAFDNDCIYRFIEDVRAAGIDKPLAIGIMPFLSKSQISRMVFMCGASLPSAVIKLLAKYENDPTALRQAGIEYACKQMSDLAEAGVDGIHTYTMNHDDIASQTYAAIHGKCL